jgi:hypothetical protein
MVWEDWLSLFGQFVKSAARTNPIRPKNSINEQSILVAIVDLTSSAP